MTLIENIKKIIMYIILLLVIVFAMMPILYMLSASFKDNMEIMSDSATFFPKHATFDNYVNVWNSDVFNVKRLTWNSIYYSVIVVAVTVGNSCLAGYDFARGHFKGKKFWYVAFSALLFINFGGANIYPTLQIVKGLHLTGSLWGLIVTKFFGISVVNIYLVKGFVEGIPKEIDEAAIIDGCSYTGIFVRILLPLLKPVIATIVMLGFQSSWNEYLMPMVFTLSNPSRGTLVAGLFSLKSSGAAATNWNILLAGSVIASVPVVAVFLAMNKYFISGLTAGAVKG